MKRRAISIHRLERSFTYRPLAAILIILLLPLALIVDRAVRRRSRPAGWITVGLVAFLFLPPLHLWALQAKAYALVSVPLLALFAISSFDAWKSNDSQIS